MTGSFREIKMTGREDPSTGEGRRSRLRSSRKRGETNVEKKTKEGQSLSGERKISRHKSRLVLVRIGGPFGEGVGA